MMSKKRVIKNSLSFKRRMNVFVLLFVTAPIMAFCFQNCAPNKMGFEQLPIEQSSVSLTATSVNCNFNGEQLNNSESVLAFRSSTVAFGQSCQSETRTCNNGVLSGSYQYASCAVGQAASCLFNGQTISHGQTVSGFLNSTVAFGQSCQSHIRTCSNGVLSGSHQYASCAVGQAASCLLNGQTILHGQTTTAFLSSTVSFGQSCQSQIRTCSNGVLSGSHQYASCVVGQAASCLFNGQTILHGLTANGFLSSTVAFGQTCQSETRRCSNGVLSGSHQYASCTVGQAASCLLNGQTILHGQTTTGFLNSTVSYGQSCQSETRRCSNGILSGSHQYASCVAGQAASCLFNGQTISHGQTTTGFLSSAVAFGQSCQSQVRTCNNGILSGSHQYASCAVAQPASCLFNGQTISHGQTTTGFLNSTVSFGQSCQSETRTCSNGVLSGSHQYASCVVGQAASCLFNGQTISHGQTTTGFLNLTVSYDQSCQSETRRCSNGVLSGSYQHASCVAQQLGTQTISVTEKSIYSPFKLLLIVDNSFTMSQSQDKLAQNIDALLAPLAGKDVSLKIISTSEAYGYVDTNTTFYKNNGTSKTFVNSAFHSLPEFKDASYVRLESKATFSEARGTFYDLKSTDSASIMAANISSIKAYIRQLGVNGSDQEQVFCPLAMHLFNRSTNSFFKQGDKAAVVVLTDENDSSKFDNCKKSENRSYEAVKVRSVADQDKYFIFGKFVKVNFSYEIYKDGILSQKLTDGVMVLDRKILKQSDIDSGQCVTKAQNYLRSLGKINSEIDFKNATISKCEKISVKDYQLMPVSKNNLCTGANQDLLNSAKNKYFIYHSVPHVTDLSVIQGEVTLENCTKDSLEAFSVTEREGVRIYNDQIINVTSDNAFDLAIKNEMDSIFDEKYFMSFIINKNDTTCSLKTGQSVGHRYESFKSNNSSRVQTIPICSANYGQALDKVAQFAISVVSKSYALSLPANSQLLRVKLKSAGVTTILDASKYTVNTARTQVEMKIDLKVGDQILIEYTY